MTGASRDSSAPSGRPGDAPTGFGVLQQLLRSRPPPPPGERCELCAAPVDPDHGHVVDVQQRALLCACRGCRLLFETDGAGGGRFRAVGDRHLVFDAVTVDDGVWEALQIPVGVAFFFHNSQLGGPVALYPSPAGATESELPLDDWEQLLPHEVTATLRPDVEALLVRRTRDATSCHLVPITACYELVGTLRQHWRGFDGGQEVRGALATFFDRLERTSRPAAPAGWAPGGGEVGWAPGGGEVGWAPGGNEEVTGT